MDFFYDNLGSSEEARDLKGERQKIKDTLAKTLSSQGFTGREVDEVLNIIEVVEVELQKIKDGLIGTNINEGIDMEDPNRPVAEAREKMREIELKMAADIKAKVAEIRERHNLN